MARTEGLNILGIIPARGGSKGIPHKNITKLNGKPLIVHTIEAAKKSKLLNKIVVSTDDKKIATISKRHGIQVIHRPSKLAKDDTGGTPVFIHTIKEIMQEDFEPDIIVILQPTSPLRNNQDIDNAIRLFLNNNCDSVVSICKVEHPPFWIFKKTNSDKLNRFIKTGKTIKRRQDSPPLYRLNGAVYVTTKQNLFKTKKIITSNIRGYVMPVERSADIDSYFDLKISELLLKHKLV